MSGPVRSLLALALGLGIGFALKASGAAPLIDLAKALKPVGTLWLSGLQMTLVPLIFALVTTGVASWSGRGGGRTLAVAMGVFIVLASFGALASMGLMTLGLQVWAPLAHVGTAAGAADSAAAHGVPPLTDQLLSLIPTNPLGAAAQGQITPMVVFALILGLALGRLPDAAREAVVAPLRGLGQAMLVIVEAVLVAAPVGIFVLALGVALGDGARAAGVLAQAVIMTSAIVALALGSCYLIARLGGGVGVRAFARAVAGPQAVAAGTTSSMASLPALIEAAQRSLGMPPEIAGSILPLAVSTFRFGNVTLIGGSAIFAAYAAGLHPSLAQILTAAVVIVLTNLGVVGLPAAAVLYAAEAPAFQALGAPLDFLPLLIAVAALPDVLDTACNVTADLAAATVVRRLIGREAETSPAVEAEVAAVS